jgi:predicted flap endonuclease-1-like 5' DNA nuclease
MSKLMNIEGNGEVMAGKLKDAVLKSIDTLLRQGASAQRRRAIAEKASISEKNVWEWVNQAYLIRIRGVGAQYADLLEEAGVDTVVELAQRNPGSLHQKLDAVNQEKKLVRRLPSLFKVTNWIDEAEKLPKVVAC